MVDDVVDVIREEATEDFLKMAGAGKDREILKSSFENIKAKFLGYLQVGLGCYRRTVIGVFENMLEILLYSQHLSRYYWYGWKHRNTIFYNYSSRYGYWKN